MNKTFLTFLFLLVVFSCSESERPVKACPLIEGYHYQLSGNAGCFISQEKKILLVRDKKSGLLGFPAGGGIKGESAMCTAYRETLEETGVKVRVGRLLANFSNENFYLFKCHVAQPLGALTVPKKAVDEITEVKLLDMNTLRAGQWRFRDQFTLMQRVYNSHVATK